MADTRHLHETLSDYLHKLESLHDVLPMLMAMAVVARRVTKTKRSKFLDKHATLLEKTDEYKRYSLNLEHQRLAGRLDQRYKRSVTAYETLPSKFLVSFVTEYDAFLGNLIKELFRQRPEILNSREKNISFSELQELGSIQAAHEHILEKEAESVLRKSHADQFTWLEYTFDLPLTKGLGSWTTFIELTERRNLFVHCNGIVSSQYLAICREHGVPLTDDVSTGTQLGASREYLEEAYRCLYEIGVKLTQVLWRKLVPTDLERADESLIRISFELIQEEQYELAKRILDFGTEILKKWSSDSCRRMLVVNRAQTYYHLGEFDNCAEILDDEDWTACGDNFQVCVAVLRDEYAEAANIMKRIGQDGLIKEADYLDWPVFKKFRESEEFKTAFRETFDKEPVNIAELDIDPEFEDVFDDGELTQDIENAVRE